MKRILINVFIIVVIGLVGITGYMTNQAMSCDASGGTGTGTRISGHGNKAEMEKKQNAMKQTAQAFKEKIRAMMTAFQARIRGNASAFRAEMKKEAEVFRAEMKANADAFKKQMQVQAEAFKSERKVN